MLGYTIYYITKIPIIILQYYIGIQIPNTKLRFLSFAACLLGIATSGPQVSLGTYCGLDGGVQENGTFLGISSLA
jgi:hypothetical protein